jgi:RNA polymerase sigma-70 factor (ECF subfamily)
LRKVEQSRIDVRVGCETAGRKLSLHIVPPRSVALSSTAIDLLANANVDGSLAARIRARDEDAFRILFERHGTAVWRFLRDVSGDPALADEGLQESFVRAFSRIEQLREDGRLLGWLLGIARNVALEQLRARRRDRPPGAVELSAEGEHAVALHLRDEPQCPELNLLGREAQSLVDRALGGLSEDRRAALLLRVDHGLPYEDIGRMMGWSIPKVKNEIHRARLKLRALLQEFHGGEP